MPLIKELNQRSRSKEDYQIVLKIEGLVNRGELVEQYLDLLRLELREAIESKNHIEIEKIDREILSIKMDQTCNSESEQKNT